MANPTIVVAVLGLIGVIVSALVTARVAKAKNQSDASGTFLNTIITRLESVEDDLEISKKKSDEQAKELIELKAQNTTLIDDQKRQQRITAELANYSLALIRHIETGKPPPPPEVPWSLKHYFDTEAT